LILINGIVLGCVYGVAATGLNLIFGPMQIVFEEVKGDGKSNEQGPLAGLLLCPLILGVDPAAGAGKG
jgi:hypothetical protein